MQKTIMLLSTGGTIFGLKKDSLSDQYQTSSMSLQDFLDHIPHLNLFLAHHHLKLQTQEICNIDSADMTDAIWLKLAQIINASIKQEYIDGVVILHGSDTIEESAYFLHLTIKSHKPIVMTGAMLPFDDKGSDGPNNLLAALQIASAKQSYNKGVLITFDRQIYSAREISKKHSLSLHAFGQESIGYLLEKNVHLHSLPAKPHTLDTPFCVDALSALPKVDIVYSYANDDSKTAIEAFVQSGTQGIIIAGTGAGSIHQNTKAYLIKKLKSSCLIVIKSSRVGDGMVMLSQDEKIQGFLGANNLNPQKARVLLMLALSLTQNKEQIRDFFDRF